jgi:ABC-type multidrug transport system fused ATPase/permease subunit
MIGRTSIVIAHRFSTVKKASRILVVRDGAIVDEGTHFQLANRPGLYRELHNLQAFVDSADAGIRTDL